MCSILCVNLCMCRHLEIGHGKKKKSKKRITSERTGFSWRAENDRHFPPFFFPSFSLLHHLIFPYTYSLFIDLDILLFDSTLNLRTVGFADRIRTHRTEMAPFRKPCALQTRLKGSSAVSVWIEFHLILSLSLFMMNITSTITDISTYGWK